jgi:hypothetical protein
MGLLGPVTLYLPQMKAATLPILDFASRPKGRLGRLLLLASAFATLAAMNVLPAGATTVSFTLTAGPLSIDALGTVTDQRGSGMDWLETVVTEEVSLSGLACPLVIYVASPGDCSTTITHSVA